jgi:hypothetical protein
MYTAIRPAQPVALDTVLSAVTSEVRKRPLTLTLAKGRRNIEQL